ncbi:MAG: TIGR02206 family membrane protein [Clostridia bacterium]|nr:TIGR02206 family membrane protein [Clostridia bacterium]
MFFITKETAPAGVGFSTFGTTHLLWLLAFVLLCAVSIIFYRRLDATKKSIMIKIIGGSVLFLEILKNIVAIAVNDFGVGHLPFHLCGINVILISFDIFKPTKIVCNFLYYLGIPGAILALLFPNWTVLPCLNFFAIHSFVIHMLLVLYPLILVTGGDIKPNIKAMPRCILLLVIMAIPIYFLNLLWNTNFMFLMDPETGNPLELFEKYLGSHLWGFPILLPIVMFIMYIPMPIASLFGKKENKDKKQEKEEVTVG